MASRTWQQRKYLNDLPVRRHCILQVLGSSTTPPSAQSPVTSAGTEQSSTGQSCCSLLWYYCFAVRFAGTWRHNMNCHCYENLAPPITIVLFSWPRHLQATGTDPGTSDTMDASFCGSVSEYLHRRDVLIPCKHCSINSIVISITDTLKTEINFNYVTFKHPVRTAQ